MHGLLTVVILFVAAVAAQDPAREVRPGLGASLGFEGTHSGNMPQGWGGNPTDTIFVDSNVVHGGKWVRDLKVADGAGSFFMASV